jgi:hypothetical protein
MKIICRKYVLYTLFYNVHKLLYLHSIYTYYLVRNGVVILTGKKGSGRNRAVISKVKKGKIAQSYCSLYRCVLIAVLNVLRDAGHCEHTHGQSTHILEQHHRNLLFHTMSLRSGKVFSKCFFFFKFPILLCLICTPYTSTSFKIVYQRAVT